VTATPSDRLRAEGKQVLLDGQHLCDARDEVAARAIAYALDFAGVDFMSIPSYAARVMMEVLR
jgi:hypothetical protein